jgi:hypothetical protein
MDGDDGSKAALRTPNRDDVLVFRPRQPLQDFTGLGRGQATHDEILWAIGSASHQTRPADVAVESLDYGLTAGGQMDPFAQAHLSELLSAARMGPPVPPADPDEQKRLTLMMFNAALAALKGVGAIADGEMADWTNRMLVALGEEPLEPVPPGTARLISFGRNGTQRPERPADPPPESRFLALVPADEPDRPLGYGGRIQILGVELYNDKVSVNWRLAPLPDPQALFAAELSEQEADLEGLSDDFKRILRDKLIQRLQMQRRSLALNDDVGTEFRSTGGGSGGGGNERRGHSDFSPGVPAQARQLSVCWDELEFVVPLPPNRDSA